MNDDNKAKFDAMPKDQRDPFLWNYRFTLVECEDNFFFQDYHEKLWCGAERSIFIEDLTRTFFFETLGEISITHRKLNMIFIAFMGLPKRQSGNAGTLRMKRILAR